MLRSWGILLTYNGHRTVGKIPLTHTKHQIENNFFYGRFSGLQTILLPPPFDLGLKSSTFINFFFQIRFPSLFGIYWYHSWRHNVGIDWNVQKMWTLLFFHTNNIFDLSEEVTWSPSIQIMDVDIVKNIFSNRISVVYVWCPKPMGFHSWDFINFTWYLISQETSSLRII